MFGRTVFDCDRVQFAGSKEDHIGGSPAEEWQPAKVFVSEITDSNCRTYISCSLPYLGVSPPRSLGWLLVTVNDDVKPVIWRVIKEDYTFVFDEVRSDYPTLFAHSPMHYLTGRHDYAHAGRAEQELRRGSFPETTVRQHEGLLGVCGTGDGHSYS